MRVVYYRSVLYVRQMVCRGEVLLQLSELNMQYQIFQLSAEPKGSFIARLDGLLCRLESLVESAANPLQRVVWSRVFLSDAANQLEQLQSHPLYIRLLSQGAFSYVEQVPLDASKVSLMVCLTSDEVVMEGTPDHCVISCNGVRHYWQSVRFTADESASLSAREQTEEAFNRHIEWLRSHGLNLKDHCVRTWLFVRDVDRHYQDVVVGRNEVFAREGLTTDTHYIASTGIAGNGDNGHELVAVDFWSVDAPAMTQQYLQALDYLNPTHEYGVAFERGTSLHFPERSVHLISGTASIDKHGHCIYVGDVLKQADRLFENISQLLADGKATLNDVDFMIVYLRDISDADAVNRYLAERFPNVPKVLVWAPVCRPQWLIEVECVASVSHGC